MEDYAALAFFVWIVGLIIGVSIYQKIRRNKLKKLKYEWTWMVKSTKIFDIKRFYHSWDEDSSSYYSYIIFSKDSEGNVYQSYSYRDLEYWGRSVSDMTVHYNWAIYELDKKDTSIKLLNDEIARVESEINNDPWLFKKMKLKSELKTLKEYVDIAMEGPINPYVVLKKHRISVGDSINVYVDPEDPRKYYFDLDFVDEILY